MKSGFTVCGKRTESGDYKPGTHGNIGNIRVNNGAGHYDELANQLKHTRINDSNYRMTSYLAKAGWNISDEQRLQFNYLETKVATPNAGTLTNLGGTWPYKLGWKSSGFSDVTAKNYSLDYTQFSDKPWSTELKEKCILLIQKTTQTPIPQAKFIIMATRWTRESKR